MTAMIEPIRRSIRGRCSVEHAFQVFTEGMSDWWPLETHSRAVDEQREGLTATGVEVERHVGGHIWELLSNGERLPWGEIVAWEPPRRLLVAWRPNANPFPPTELEITFAAEAGAARVTLEHRGWERLVQAEGDRHAPAQQFPPEHPDREAWLPPRRSGPADHPGRRKRRLRSSSRTSSCR
jgi:uncharacterized protein YndB with AHSA1/START domain